MPTSYKTLLKKSISLAALVPLLSSLSTPVVARETGNKTFGTEVSAAATAARHERLQGTAKKVSTRKSEVGAQEQNVSQDDKARHLLNRITYGPTLEDLDHLHQVGIDRYIDEQLNPDRIKEPDGIVALVSQSPALTQSPAQLFMNYARPVLVALAKAGKFGPNAQNNAQLARAQAAGQERMMDEVNTQVTQPAAQAQDNQSKEDQKKELNKLIGAGYKELYTQVCDARIKRAVYSPRQLQEVMTDFWFNHFNISMDKGLDHVWVGSFEEQAIRPYALGKFRDLLGATAHHAAMMFYLDNNQNSRAKDAQLAQGQKPGRFSGLNENYARELMELHTLGVDGGYTQKDVTELARVLTGNGIINQQSVRRNPDSMNDPFGFMFDKNRHDFGDKVVLGNVIKGSGEQEVEQALDILAKHPSTAHHISYQLAQYFVADDPPSTLVDKMAATFTRTDGDIKEVLRTMFKSNEFWDRKYYDNKFKSPYRYMISSLRASEATIQNTQPLLGFLAQQGMPLYRCLTPDGYKNTQSAWLNSSTLLQRVNFATALGSGRYPGAKVEDITPEEIMNMIGVAPGSTTADSVQSAPPQLKISLLIGSPEFMRY